MKKVELSELPLRYQKQVLEKLRQNESAKRETPKSTKYRSTQDSRGQLKFDSQKEARRFDQLSLELAAGEIRDLRLQVEFTLQPAYTAPTGERVRAIRYLADFTYYRRDGQSWAYVVEDVKSAATKTKTYMMKRKMMADRFGLTITEV